jgi:hypothetical protein
MKRIYVAGPITRGDQFLNVRAAVLVAEQLRSLGFAPFVPHISALWHIIAPVSYEDWLAYDFSWIDVCDGLLRIPGDSPGADREWEYAQSINKPTFIDIDSLLEHFKQEQMNGDN